MIKADLENAIEEANMAYSAGIPFMTDQEYDVLWQALHAIDPKHELLYHTAKPHQQVHGKTWHKHTIFGTNKAFGMEDLKPFMMRFGDQHLVIEPKYDGCAAVITKTISGVQLTLEGDGKSGRDVTNLLPYINIPFQMRNFQAVEILLPVAEWNPEYGKNPRNVVAGWLNRTLEAPDANMTAVPHAFGELTVDYKYDGNLDLLGEILIKLHAEWSKIYPIDGLMLKVKSEKARMIAGNNGTTSAWSIAWKPPIQIKGTTVRDIEWNVSRLGRVVPTIVYDPIDLCGTINTRVTGNNARWVLEKNIGIQSHITVGKAGEIIPKIIDVNNDYRDLNVPVNCPKCNSELEWEGVHLVCESDNCIAKKIVSIAYFYSNKGIKVDGIGESMIEKLLNNETCYEVLITKPWALLDMSSYELMPAVVETLGETSFINIMNEVFEIFETKDMSHFIAGLGIQGLAFKSALKLCQYVKTGKLASGVPAKAIQSFPGAAALYVQAAEEMKVFKFATTPEPAKAKYAITGSLSLDRDAMIEMLNGYSFGYSATVTMDTNYLIIGEGEGKTKINKAIKYGIPQITEEQLMNILKEQSNV